MIPAAASGVSRPTAMRSAGAHLGAAARRAFSRPGPRPCSRTSAPSRRACRRRRTCCKPWQAIHTPEDDVQDEQPEGRRGSPDQDGTRGPDSGPITKAKQPAAGRNVPMTAPADSLAAPRARGTSTTGEGLRMIADEVRLHLAPFAIAVSGATVFALATVASSWAVRWMTDDVIVPRFEAATSPRPTVIAGAAMIIAIGIVRSVGRRRAAGVGGPHPVPRPRQRAGSGGGPLPGPALPVVPVAPHR